MAVLHVSVGEDTDFSDPNDNIIQAAATGNLPSGRPITDFVDYQIEKSVMNSDYGETNFFGGATSSTVWVKWAMKANNSTSPADFDNPYIEFVRSGTPYQRLKYTNLVPALEVFTSSAWSALDTHSGALPTDNNQHLYKIELVVNSSTGVFRFWQDDTLILEATSANTQGDSGDALVDGYRIYPGGSSSNLRQLRTGPVIVMDTDPGAKMAKVLRITGAGNANTFTSGAHTDLDEATTNLSDLAVSDTADQLLQAASNDTIPTGYLPEMVGVTALAQKTATGPQQIALNIRSGTTDSDGTTQALPSDWLSGSVYETWDVDPADSLEWTTGDFPIQIGVKSKT